MCLNMVPAGTHYRHDCLLERNTVLLSWIQCCAMLQCCAMGLLLGLLGSSNMLQCCAEYPYDVLCIVSHATVSE